MSLAGFAADAQPWTAADDDALRTAYLAGGIEAARAALPDRTTHALYRRANRLSLSRRRRWTAADDARLRKLWDGCEALDAIAEQLGRTKLTTYWRAQKLGLPLGVPEGWEYLSSAAKRTGYETSQLRRILRADSVEIRPVLARPTQPRGKAKARRKVCWMVWPAAVDAAVEVWHERETVAAAAARVGIGAESLAKRLEAIGVKKPRKRKAHWRVTAEDVQRAMDHRFVHYTQRRAAA